MTKNRLILTGIFIEMGMIEIEYEPNKIKVFTKIDEEPNGNRIIQFTRKKYITTFYTIETNFY